MKNNLLDVIASDTPKWQMSQAERITAIGLLHLIQPKLVLEIGTNAGGCTRWLCKMSETVYSVDIADVRDEEIKKLPNLKFLNMKSDDAFLIFKNKSMAFDLTLIDGDHTKEGAAKDLERALDISSIILLHDTFNPECREGYQNVISQKNDSIYYHNLDFQQGGVEKGEMWGGLGIIIVKSETSANFIEQTSNFEYVQNQLTQQNKSGFWKNIF